MSLDFADGLERVFGVGAEDNSDIKILMYFVRDFLVLCSEGSGGGFEVFQSLLFEEAGEIGFDFLSQQRGTYSGLSFLVRSGIMSDTIFSNILI
jgi:hypothetical protein